MADEATVTESTDTTTVTSGPPSVLDDFGKGAWERAKSVIEAYNALANKYKASQGDPLALLEVLRSEVNSDPKIEKVRLHMEDLYTQYEKASNELDSLLKPQVESMQAEGQANVEAILTERDAAHKKARAAVNYLTELYGDEAITGLPKIAAKAQSGSSSSDGTQKRIRGFDFFVNGKLATKPNPKGEQVSNLAAAAAVCGIEADAMRQHFWTAQGTQESKDFKDSVTFEVTVNDTKYTVLARRQAEAAKETASPAKGETAA